MLILMDSENVIGEMKKLVKKFCDERDWDQFHDAKELSIALALESSELLEFFRWKKPRQVKEILEDKEVRGKIGEEMADVLFPLIRISQIYDIDITESFFDKIKKNEEKYHI